MKRQLLIPCVLLVIIFAYSCREAAYFEPRMESISIIESLDAVPFSFKGDPDSVQMSFLYKVVSINSIEELVKPFETFDLDVSDVLEQYDYENYTFLLRFYVYFGFKEVEHKLFRDKETGIYSYYISFYGNDGINTELFFFYSGILVPKISGESEIIALFTSS